MTMKKRFGIGAASDQDNGEAVAQNRVAPPPPSISRPLVDDDTQRELTQAAARTFGGVLPRPSTELLSPEASAENTSARTAPILGQVRQKREEQVQVFIRAPKSVADRFNEMLEEQNLRAKWDGLKLLLDLYDQAKEQQ
ncbi:MAG: hypothetical protein AB7U61_16810 [Methylocystis sp.]